MRRSVPLLTSLLLFVAAAGQNIDSLKKVTVTSKNDSLRCDALNWLCYELLPEDATKALSYGIEARAIAERLKNTYLLSRAYERIAECYADMGRFPDAYAYYNTSISLTRKLKDTLFLGKSLNNLASCFYYEGKLDSSLLINLQALAVRRSIGDKQQVAQSLNNIGMVYRVKRDYLNSIKFYRESLQLKKETGDEKGILNTSINIANAFKALKQYDSSLYYYNSALILAEKRNSSNDMIDCRINMGLLHNSKGEYDKGLSFFELVAKEPSIRQYPNYSILLTGMGEAWLGKRSYSTAVYYLEEALKFTAKGNKYEVPAQLNYDLSEAYKGLTDYKKALEHFEAFKVLSDSLLNETNMQHINELSTQYETKQKEHQITLLNTQNAIKDISLESKQRQILLYIIGLAAAVVAAIGAFQLYRNKQKTSRQLEEKNRIISVSLAEKEVLLKEIHHRVKNNLQVVSSLLSLQSKSIKDLQAIEAINEGRNRVKSMALIHQNLYRDDNLTGIDIADYIEKLAESLFSSYKVSSDDVRLTTDIDQIDLDVDTVIPLGLILNELISNSLKYAFTEKKNGLLEVKLKKEGDDLCLSVKDNGKGLPADWDISKLSSLGYQLVRSFALKMKAELSVNGNNGTEVQMKITKYKLAQAL
jgi:two-component system, sensor histidine kinase PdtaS